MKLQFNVIALDVDGTLLDDRYHVSEGTVTAIRRAAEAGAHIVLCTGRGPQNTLPVLERLGVPGVVITHNGGAIVDSVSRELLHLEPLDLGDVQPLVQYCRERGVHFDMNTAFDLYVESLNDETRAMYSKYLISPIETADALKLPELPVKLTAFGDEAVMDQVERDWAAPGGSLRVIRSGVHFVDVMQEKATKGRALQWLTNRLGVPRERVVAMGNYFNDMEMLSFAGLGIAMDNSPDAVKAAADKLTASNNEEGVLRAIETYVFA